MPAPLAHAHRRRLAGAAGAALAALTALLVVPSPGRADGAGPGGYAHSLSSRPAPDETVARATCDNAVTPRGTADEERRTGTGAWRDGARPGMVSGWLDATTAVCGQVVGAHLSGHGPAVVSAYRVGWYHGRGARLVWSSTPVAVTRHAVPAATSEGMVETTWPRSLGIRVDAGWLPGLYLLVARPLGQPHATGAAMPLVVRSSRPAPLLAVASTLTWQAYNRWGGRSTYVGPPRDIYDRARQVSFDRPYAEAGLDHVFTYDAPLARFLGREGWAADWTSEDSVDREPTQVLQRRAVVFGGHTEYWTVRMYDALEAARNAGVNVAFLGANPIFWQVRLSPDGSADRRRMTVYKHLDEDQLATRQPALATIKWRDAPVSRDEAELVGETYAAGDVQGSYLVTDAPAWLLAGTGLRPGDALPAAASNEVDTLDGVRSGDRSPDVQDVLTGTWADRTGHVGLFDATYYTAPSGAGVFAAGTTAWPCDLDQSCPPSFGPGVDRRTALRMRTVTENVLVAMTTPGFLAAHPSHPSARPSAPLFRQRTPVRLRGVSGPRTRGGLNDD